MNALQVMFQSCQLLFFCFFFNDTATTEIYTLSLHDALPISEPQGMITEPPESWDSLSIRDFVRLLKQAKVLGSQEGRFGPIQYSVNTENGNTVGFVEKGDKIMALDRSEEHTSELQSLVNLVCRLLLEKKKIKKYIFKISKSPTPHRLLLYTRFLRI